MFVYVVSGGEKENTIGVFLTKDRAEEFVSTEKSRLSKTDSFGYKWKKSDFHEDMWYNGSYYLQIEKIEVTD